MNNNVKVLVRHTETCNWHIYVNKMLYMKFGPFYNSSKYSNSKTFAFYFGYWYISFTHYNKEQ